MSERHSFSKTKPPVSKAVTGYSVQGHLLQSSDHRQPNLRAAIGAAAAKALFVPRYVSSTATQRRITVRDLLPFP